MAAAVVRQRQSFIKRLEFAVPSGVGQSSCLVWQNAQLGVPVGLIPFFGTGETRRSEEGIQSSAGPRRIQILPPLLRRASGFFGSPPFFFFKHWSTVRSAYKPSFLQISRFQGFSMKSEICAELGQWLELQPVVEGKLTYPSWTTSAEYSLEVEQVSEKEILVFYRVLNSAVPRLVKRLFPSRIELSSSFFWVLGFLEGEGANKLGKSNYRRVTITNSNAKDMRAVLDELERQWLLKRIDLPVGAVQIFVKDPSEKVEQYWRAKLNVSPEQIRLFEKSNATSPTGICHIYVSDVLLRRVIDLIQEHLHPSVRPPYS